MIASNIIEKCVVKMKIVIVITDYGSFNNFLAELAINLSSENEIHVICSDVNIINIINKFDYTQYNLVFHKVHIPRTTSVLKLIKSSFEISKIIKEVNPKLVCAHFTTGIFPSILFRVRSIEYWGVFHGLGMNSTKGLRKIMFFIVEIFSLMRLDRRFLINNKDFKLVSNIFIRNTFKYNSCGVGCDINKFDKDKFNESDIHNLKKKLNIDDKFVITYTGRFVKFKGFDLVYRSFINLANEFPHKFILLLIGGRDSIHSTGLSEQEETDLLINSNIINIGFTSEVEKYLALSDVFLFPSKKEGLPVCIIEALAMGLPVITLDERGNSDVVKDGFNGYLIESISKIHDTNVIYLKLKHLYENPNVLDLLSKNSLINRKKYSRTLFIDEQLKLVKNFKKGLKNESE